MTYRLYGEQGSGSCVVECALAEAKAAYERVNVDLEKSEQLSPDYAAVNPARKIPALQLPNGHVITESAAILLTLAEREPQANLLPAVGSDERAEAFRWLLYIATEIYPAIEIIDYPDRFAPDPAFADRVRETARERLRARWAPVEQAATDHGAMLPSGFSLLDIYAATLSRWSVGDEWRSANLPKLDAVAHVVASRPLCGPVFKRHFPS